MNYINHQTFCIAWARQLLINIGPLSSTGSICSEEIMNQEQAYLANLQSASQYEISGNTLTLTTPTGPLVFTAAVPAPFAGP